MNYYYTIDKLNHGCTGKKYANRLEAILDSSYNVYSEGRVRRMFNFGNGTFNDLKRFCKDNHTEMLTEKEFMKEFDRIPADLKPEHERFLAYLKAL